MVSGVAGRTEKTDVRGRVVERVVVAVMTMEVLRSAAAFARLEAETFLGLVAALFLGCRDAGVGRIAAGLRAVGDAIARHDRAASPARLRFWLDRFSAKTAERGAVLASGELGAGFAIAGRSHSAF